MIRISLELWIILFMFFFFIEFRWLGNGRGQIRFYANEKVDHSSVALVNRIPEGHINYIFFFLPIFRHLYRSIIGRKIFLCDLLWCILRSKLQYMRVELVIWSHARYSASHPVSHASSRQQPVGVSIHTTGYPNLCVCGSGTPSVKVDCMRRMGAGGCDGECSRISQPWNAIGLCGVCWHTTDIAT